MTSSRDQVGVGIIGAGIMGESYTRIVEQSPAGRVAAIASRSRGSADKLAALAPGSVVCDSWRDLLARPDVDAVIISTPDPSHAEIAVAAADAGKALLVEKPLATSAADARAIVAAAARSGVPAGCAFNHRWLPPYAETYARISAGELGKPVLGYAHKNDRIFVPTQMINWADSTTSAWFLSSHDIDLVTWFFGQRPMVAYATAVYGKLLGLGIQAPDAIQAQVRYSEGAVATFESCWVYPDTFPNMVDSYVEFVGTEGVVHLDRRRDQFELSNSSGFQTPSFGTERTIHGRLSGSVVECVADFLDSVTDHRQPYVPVAQAAVTTAVLEAIHASTKSGVPESIAG